MVGGNYQRSLPRDVVSTPDPETGEQGEQYGERYPADAVKQSISVLLDKTQPDYYSLRLDKGQTLWHSFTIVF